MGADLSDQSEHLAQAALDCGCAVAVAESLTSGAMASALGAAPQASEWFRGAVVAYSADVKHGLLGVPEGPVVSKSAVSAMAEQTAHLLGADVTLAVSGVGGPDPQDGQPVGTVWFAVHSQSSTSTERCRFDGDPEAVVHQTVQHGLDLLLQAISTRQRDDGAKP
jgi:nicotinamide-nucleotide amidase